MKLLKAQVENFRSVDDSNEFAIDSNMTCLVGKNESGKTTLLTALYRLNPIFDNAKFDRQKDYPRRHLSDYSERHGAEEANVVRTWWAIEPKEKKAIVDKFGSAALQSDEVEVSKGYANKTLWRIHTDEGAIVNHLISTSNLHDEEKAQIGVPKTIADLKNKVSALPDPSERKSEFAQRIETNFPEASVFKGVVEFLELPKFLLFSQYQRMQGQVSLDQILQRKANNTLTEDDQVFTALCEMASVTVEDASSLQEFESLVSRFEGASNKISAEIFKYWSQNKYLKVIFRMDAALPNDPAPFNAGRIFRTRIFNQLHEVTVPFDDRSTGFVWFFSFLALFSQVKKRHNGNIILLLDEPGLSLHGKAQADLLRYFNERLVSNHQIIYTTHSPFMVPVENLFQARTVEDITLPKEDGPPDVLGTKVGSDVLSTDKDTLFPLQAALGYEITQSLFVGAHTLLVEGPSDFLYLKTISGILQAHQRTGLDPRWTICPTGSIDKVGAFMSLFGSNKLHIAVLTDFATGQKKKVDEVRRSKILRDGHVFTLDAYSQQPEADIEDMLGSALYPQIVNACYNLSGSLVLTPPPAASRIAKHTETHFKTLPNTVPEFDHYTPAAYFMENQSIFDSIPLADQGVVLDRFERLFADLNALLPSQQATAAA